MTDTITLVMYITLRGIVERDISLRARLHWFISAYWQTFIATGSDITKDSIKEAKEVIFKLMLYPYLSEKGKKMREEMKEI